MTRAPAFLVLCVLSYGAMTGCGALATEDSTQQAVEDAREAGLTPYWLGESFTVNGLEARVVETAFYSPPEPPQLVFHYFLVLDDRVKGRVSITTYLENERGWAPMLDGARRLPATTITQSHVGAWNAELWLVPLDDRVANTVMYKFDFDDMAVIATAKAASTGDPATDVNPLIDPELWAQVLEEHLQPYPE